MQTNSSIAVAVALSDALLFQSDVLVLKYAQRLYGVDKAVHARLSDFGMKLSMPIIGAYLLVDSRNALGADKVLFLGVPQIYEFDYGEIRQFGYRAMTTVAQSYPQARHLALTIHGPGYGLDETESFESELAGVVEAISQGNHPGSLETLTFIEHDGNRARRLQAILSGLLPAGRLERNAGEPMSGLDGAAEHTLRNAGPGSAAKPRVFVAMPFADEMADLFHYGIQGAVNSAGLLAERADLASFTGDVMEWVRARIAGANLVVADLTSSNPNVFLEIGYAWGKGVPTVLIARHTEELKFDVRGQRCIRYSSIKDLQDKLARELSALRPNASSR